MAPVLLSSPEVLHAVGLAGAPTGAMLEFEHAGRTFRAQLEAEPEPFVISHDEGAGRPPGWADARPASADTALSRRHPGRAYWYEYVRSSELLYIQYDMVNNAPEGPGVHEFFSDALSVLDSVPVERVVLDLRANGGGEGGLNTGVVRQMIRRPELQDAGSLFVLIGRRTFSAAQVLAHMLDQWTPAIFIGEPTGSAPQFWGDHRWIELNHSEIQVSASPTWWQPGGPYDRRPFLPPLLAFEPRFEDYAAGRDPALAAVINWDHEARGFRDSLLSAIASGDTVAAVSVIHDWSANPVHRYRTATAELNRLGYQLLGEHRMDDAIAVFKVNVTAHPDYANGWDSLGDVLMRAGRHEEGLAAYRTAYDLDPTVGTAARVLGLTTEH